MIDLSMRSLLLSCTLPNGTSMHYCEALFHFLDGAIDAINQL